MVYAFLLIFGVCLGSFVNALVWRTMQREKSGKKNKDLSVMNGRSMCPYCRHHLSAKDLIPLVSWIMLRGKCRYCSKPISAQYPLVELAGAAVFVLSYVFWPQSVQGGQIVLFITWLTGSVGLLALFVYDLKTMILPNSIIYPTLLVVFTGRLIYLVAYQSDKAHAAGQWVLSLAVASGIFAVLYFISRGRWIGFGDVRLGLITGTLLASPANSFLMIFLASVLGTAAAVPQLREKGGMTAKIPYGPFLIMATMVCILFGAGIIDWYKRLSGI